MEDKLKKVAQELGEQNTLMNEVNKNLLDFIDKYKLLQAELGKITAPDSVDLAKKINEVTSSIQKTQESVKLYSDRVDNGIESVNNIANGFEAVKNGLKEVEDRLFNTNKQSIEFLKAQEKTISTINNLDESVKTIQNIDFSNYETMIKTYTEKLGDLTNKVDDGLQKQLSDNSQKIEKIETAVEQLILDSFNQGKLLAELVDNIKKSNEVLLEVSRREYTYEESFKALMDKWADENGVKRKK